jgi:hypothetical protein
MNISIGADNKLTAMETKICNKCGEEKEITLFRKCNRCKDGYRGLCKACFNLERKAYPSRQLKAKRERRKHQASKQPEAIKERKRTSFQKQQTIYGNMSSHQKKRGHGSMPFTLKEFRKWLNNNGWDKLYKTWKESGFEKTQAPSIDRLDNSKGYTFEDMELVTWKENYRRAHAYPKGIKFNKILGEALQST